METKSLSKRVTPYNITDLQPNEVFVFGSNLSGRHGAGAAKTALKWGAKWGTGIGLSGQTYGIPTKDALIKQTLTLDEIAYYVNQFLDVAAAQKYLTFLVTEVGCGLAGLKPAQVAPLFAEARDIQNIHLPQAFWDILNKNGEQ